MMFSILSQCKMWDVEGTQYVFERIPLVKDIVLYNMIARTLNVWRKCSTNILKNIGEISSGNKSAQGRFLGKRPTYT